MKKKIFNKKFIIIIVSLLVVIATCVALLIILGKDKDDKKNKKVKKKEEPKVVEKVDVVNVKSKTRPFAVVVNNTPVAVKVQEGVTKAYIVYELPTEGSTSRLVAIYKDIDDLTIGTIRSVRHNFIDFAYENDAILVGHGWSHYAEDELKGGNAIINNINGMVDSSFWRNNPEGLASEHTSYTNLSKLKELSKSKGFNLESNNWMLLKYNTGDVDLSSKEGVVNASKVTLPYGNITTVFNYDPNTKLYTKNVNGVDIKDHATGEGITTKNIIVEKITYEMCKDNYYWNLHTVGSGDGYFITNGKSVPIKWSKGSRKEKTKYTYLDGSEIEVSDGKTYIEVQVTSKTTTIE